MKETAQNKMWRVAFFTLLAVQLFCLLAWCAAKQSYFVDEYFSFGLANNRGSIYMQVEDGKPYTGTGPFLNYLSADPADRFSYDIVWQNQAADVHPPLYYAIMHTVCSFFPGSFSKWLGLVPNLMLFCLAQGLLFALGKELFQKDAPALAVMAVYGFSVAAVNTVLFIRMYMLLAVFVLAVTLVLVHYYDKPKDKRFWLCLFFGVLGGTLTQYYFLVYLFFLCLFFGVRLLWQRQYRIAASFALDLALAGATSTAVFPAMLRQIFAGGEGSRGQEAFQNALQSTDFFDKAAGYAKLLNEELFGGLLLWLVLAVAVGFALVVAKTHQGKAQATGHTGRQLRSDPVWMLAFALAGYGVVLCKIAPYTADRYMMAQVGCLALVAFYLLHCVATMLLPKQAKRWATSGVALLLALGVLLSYRQVKWEPQYIYRTRTQKMLDKTAAEIGLPAVYVYDGTWKVMGNMAELARYENYTFVPPDQVEGYLQQHQTQALVLYVAKPLEAEKTAAQAVAAEQAVSRATQLYKDGYATVYRID